MPEPSLTLDQVLQDYDSFLRMRGHDAVRGRFRSTIENDREAAAAEAVTWNIAIQLRWNPRCSDLQGTGGADFLCTAPDGTDFHLEATTLQAESLARRTGMSLMPSPGRYDPQSGIGPAVWSKVERKRRQLDRVVRETGCPSVLSLVLFHYEANTMLRFYGLLDIIASPQQFEVVRGRIETERRYTDLRRSLFYERSEDGSVSLKREWLSALLLVTFDEGVPQLCAAVHPEPTVAIAPESLAPIPYATVSETFAVDGQMIVRYSDHEEQFLPVRLAWHWRAPQS